MFIVNKSIPYFRQPFGIFGNPRTLAELTLRYIAVLLSKKLTKSQKEGFERGKIIA